MDFVMHAFIIHTGSLEKINQEVYKIVKSKKAKLFEFPVYKIEDVRSLQAFTKLALNQPTVIYLGNIEKTTHEALNAFLKNLEEPQENLTYVLAASNLSRVLPTIVSRCQVVKVGQDKNTLKSDKLSSDFLNLTSAQRLTQTSQIKTRVEATDFLEKLINSTHQLLVSGDPQQKKLAKTLIVTDRTLQAIRGNGNVQLHLTNMVVSFG